MNSSLGIHLLLRAAAVGGAGLLQLVPEGSENPIQRSSAGPIVTLKEPVYLSIKYCLISPLKILDQGCAEEGFNDNDTTL